MKVLTYASRLLFVTIYVAGTLLFDYLLGILDGGSQPLSLGLWIVMLTGGLVIGLLASSLETALYHRHGLWPSGLLPFMLRSILFATAWISLGYTITCYLVTLQEVLPPGTASVSWSNDLLAAPALFLCMLPSAGIVAPFVGAATGLLVLNDGRRRASRLAAPAALTQPMPGARS